MNINIINFVYYKKNLNWGIQMGQKEPVKITLSGMIRWVFGLFFIVIAAGMVTEREYFPAVFVFVAAFVSFPPISNLLESDLNISISGPVRFLVVILLLVGSVAVEPNHSSSAVIYAHTSSGSNSSNQDNNVSYWEWEWHMPSHIGDTKAPKGYE
jgi:hypothetical protein